MPVPEAIPENLLPVLDRIAEVLNERQVSYALIGGLGVALRGPIRATRDIDLLINIPQLDLPGVLDELTRKGFQLDVAETIRAWNRDHLMDFTSGSVRIDCLKPVLPALEHVLNRARWEQIGPRPVRVVDAEGLLLLKLIAFRPRDQEDIKGILASNAGSLDLDWVRREWSQLADGDDPRLAEFERWIREFYGA